MNMTLSKRGDYVMRSAIALARAFDSGVPRKIREVVADTELPRTFASQILADLVRAGLAKSKAGRDGGYWLSRPPDDISVLEVIEAGEGPLHAERCALGDGPCRWERVCPLHETWLAATARLNGLLAETSLAEVAARDAAIEAGLYPTPADSHRTRAVVVEVADAVHVELGAAAVSSALARHSIDLGSLAATAASETGALSPEAAPAAGASPVRVVATSLDDVGRATARDPARYMLAWELAGPEASSRFEGELSVQEVDDERSEVRVAGNWHQDVVGDTPPNPAALQEMTRRTLRRFLRSLARSAEEGPAPVIPSAVGVPSAPRRGRARSRTA